MQAIEDIAKALDKFVVRQTDSGVSPYSADLEFNTSTKEVVLRLNRDSLILVARDLVALALKKEQGSHIHYDEANVFDNPENTLIVVKAVSWLFKRYTDQQKIQRNKQEEKWTRQKVLELLEKISSQFGPVLGTVIILALILMSGLIVYFHQRMGSISKQISDQAVERFKNELGFFSRNEQVRNRIQEKHQFETCG